MNTKPHTRTCAPFYHPTARANKNGTQLPTLMHTTPLAARIYVEAQAGKTKTAISRETGVDRKTISYWIAKLEQCIASDPKWEQALDRLLEVPVLAVDEAIDILKDKAHPRHWDILIRVLEGRLTGYLLSTKHTLEITDTATPEENREKLRRGLEAFGLIPPVPGREPEDTSAEEVQ